MICSAALLLSGHWIRPSGADKPDRVGRALRLEGSYYDEASDEAAPWCTRRTPVGLVLFFGVGFLGGMFGMGAGWASVPVLSLVMGVPLKVAAGTSNFLVLMTGASASWVYLNSGCVIPLITVPSILGLMLGASLSAKLLSKVRPAKIRFIIVGVLVLAGVRMLLKGLGI